MNKWLERALQLALENVKMGGHPFGAVLIKNGEIVSEGVNELHIHHDVSGHAELLAIRKAQKILGTSDLSDCVMFASGEPCPMCMTAMYFTGMKKVHYAQSVEEAAEAGLSLSKQVYEELSLTKEDRSITMVKETVKNPDLNAIYKFKEKTGGGK